MATRKNPEIEAEEQVNQAEGQAPAVTAEGQAPAVTAEAQAPAVTAEAQHKDPWQEMVQIFVPRKAKGDDQTWLVIVNDRYHGVPANGRMQTLPRPVAEILQNAIDAETDAAEYMDRVTSEARENAKQLM